MQSLIVLLVALFALSSALKFDLPAQSSAPKSNKYDRCIRNFVSEGTLVVVTTTTDGTKEDNQNVDITIHDTAANQYGKGKNIAGEHRMAFTAHADAAFDVCFTNYLTSGRTCMGDRRARESDTDI